MGEVPKGKKLNYAKRFFTDKDLEALPLREVNYPYEEVDFSQNGLSAEGLRKVIDLCLKCEKLRVLKLFKNDIDDEGAEALANFVRKCRTIEEMHLSHNHFTAKGVESIVSAAAETRPSNMNPLWLRLEQNDVADPDRVIRDLQSRLSVCPRKDSQRCTVRTCVKDCKVHIPHLIYQRGGPQEGRWENKGGQEAQGGRGKKTKRRRRARDEDGGWANVKEEDDDEQARRRGESPDDRPPRRRRGLKLVGGIFGRAIAGFQPGDGKKGERKNLPANVASRTLGALGVLTSTSPPRRGKVKLVGADEVEDQVKREASQSPGRKRREASPSPAHSLSPRGRGRRPPPRDPERKRRASQPRRCRRSPERRRNDAGSPGPVARQRRRRQCDRGSPRPPHGSRRRRERSCSARSRSRSGRRQAARRKKRSRSGASCDDEQGGGRKRRRNRSPAETQRQPLTKRSRREEREPASGDRRDRHRGAEQGAQRNKSPLAETKQASTRSIRAAAAAVAVNATPLSRPRKGEDDQSDKLRQGGQIVAARPKNAAKPQRASTAADKAGAAPAAAVAQKKANAAQAAATARKQATEVACDDSEYTYTDESEPECASALAARPKTAAKPPRVSNVAVEPKAPKKATPAQPAKAAPKGAAAPAGDEEWEYTYTDASDYSADEVEELEAPEDDEEMEEEEEEKADPEADYEIDSD